MGLIKMTLMNRGAAIGSAVAFVLCSALAKGAGGQIPSFPPPVGPAAAPALGKNTPRLTNKDADAFELSKASSISLASSRVSLNLAQAEAGRLALTYWKKGGAWPSSLLLLNTGIKDESQQLAPFTYQARRSIGAQAISFVIFRPQFSASGRYLLLKFGNTWSFSGPSYLYMWDTELNILSRASSTIITNYFPSISSDGKYVSYIQGGDATGEPQINVGPDTQYSPLSLYVANWQQKKDSLIATNDSVRGPVSWAPPHNPVWGMITKEGMDRVSYGKYTSLAGQPIRPNIYEYNPESGKTTLLIKDGYRPTVSPDGSHIAFWGSENIDKPVKLREGWLLNSQESTLIVTRRGSIERIPLSRFESSGYPHVLWFPDNKHLLTIHQTAVTPAASAEIRKWDIAAQTFKTIATINAVDFKYIPKTIIDPTFRPVALSRDGKSLFLFINEYTGSDKPVHLEMTLATTLTTLKKVNLEMGEVSTVLEVKNAMDVDWHESNSPAAQN